MFRTAMYAGRETSTCAVGLSEMSAGDPPSRALLFGSELVAEHWDSTACSGPERRPAGEDVINR